MKTFDDVTALNEAKALLREVMEKWNTYYGFYGNDFNGHIYNDDVQEVIDTIEYWLREQARLANDQQ